jgi:hypothetical protein
MPAPIVAIAALPSRGHADYVPTSTPRRACSMPSARANRALAFRRRIERPSRVDLVRPDTGRLLCTTLSAGPWQRWPRRQGQTRVGLGFHRFALRAAAPTRERVIFQQVPYGILPRRICLCDRKEVLHVASHEAY